VAPDGRLGLVLVAGGVIVTQFLRSAVDYYCNVDEIDEPHRVRRRPRLRLQGVVERGSIVEDAGDTDFLIGFNGVVIPVVQRRTRGHLQGVHLRGGARSLRRRHTRCSLGDRVEVKHSDEYVAVNDDRLDEADALADGAMLTGTTDRAVMLAVSFNGALGHAGSVPARRVGGRRAVDHGAIVTTTVEAFRQALAYAWLILIGSLVAVIAMQLALQARDYSLAYVQQVGSSSTPRRSTTSRDVECARGVDPAVGRGPGRFHGGGRVAVPQAHRRRPGRLGADRDVRRHAVLRAAVVRAGQPVRCRPPVPGFDGPGPNPLLQNHILVLFHPPILYLGYVGFTVPFAFAIAALITGRVGEGWLMETRRWALFSWGFLTIGILLGGWWSYEVLGWSGVWAWDPVENASLLPWLTGTAYIHSVLVQQRRGMLRVWNLSLLVATFALTILGTFLTRSGIISSVHAFAAGDVDGYLLGFFIAGLGRVARA
jgi:hypothetical protein